MLAILSTPLLYMMGSLVNGLCNPNGHEDFTTSTSTTTPFYSLTWIQTAPLLLAGVLVGLASAVATTSAASSSALYPTLFDHGHGLQKFVTSMLLPGNLLRTAHFSGITSDLGTVLGQTLRQQHGKATTSLKVTKNFDFWTSPGQFLDGGYDESVGFPLWRIPPSVALLASAMGYLLVWATMTGTYSEKITLTTNECCFKANRQISGSSVSTAADMVRRRRHDGAPKNVYQS